MKRFVILGIIVILTLLWRVSLSTLREPGAVPMPSKTARFDTTTESGVVEGRQAPDASQVTFRQEEEKSMVGDSKPTNIDAAAHPAWPGAKVLARHEAPPVNGLATRVTLVQPTNFPYAVFLEEQLNGLEAPDEKRMVRRFEAVANHLLVKLHQSDDSNRLAAIVRQFRGRIRPHPTAALLYFVDLPELKLDGVRHAQAILANYPETIAYAEPDAIVRAAATTPNDPRYAAEQWGLNNTGQDGGTAGVDVDAPEAWDTRHDAGSVIVAVVDSGIRYTHEDLTANMWRNPREIAGNGLDDDQNGFVDDVHGINAIDDSSEPLDDLPNAELGVGGHGTSVAGVIGAAGNNGKGIAGVAWKVQLMALKWFNNQGAGALSDAIQCMDYARANGAAMVNASWQQGGLLSTEVNQSMMEALHRLRDAGIIFVASAGNDGVDNDQVAHYPSNYPFDNMIAVAAGTHDGVLWRKSNFGERLVDVVAPGENILAPTSAADDSYELVSGTSFAAPHVTGMLAILKAQFPEADYTTLIDRVLSGAERRDRLTGKVRTGAFVNLSRALDLAEVVGFPEIIELSINGEKIVEPEVSLIQGTNVTLAVTAIGSPPLAYSWRRDGQVLNGITNASYSIPGFAASDIGEYQVAVSNASGVATLSVRLLGVVHRPQLSSALNAPSQSFFSSGNTLWDSQNTISRDGVSAGVSGKITARQGTVATTTVIGPAKISFAWSVSSERENDTLDFLIDEVRVESISGEVAWTKREFILSPGVHHLRWTYVKDASLSKGADKGYLDLFEYASEGKIAPAVAIQPLGQTVLEGADVFLSIVATGSEPIAYQWHKDNVIIAGATSNRLELAGVTLADEGRYSVTVSNDAGASSSASARLTITPAGLAPRLTSQPVDISVNSGGSATLRATASGTQPMHFQWRKDGADLTGQTNSILNLTNTAPSDSGGYSVVISNTAGTATSSEAKVTVFQVQLAPVITKQPVDTTRNEGERLELAVEVSGLGPFTYQWSRNGRVLPEQTESELVIRNATHLDTGNYQVRINSPFGAVVSDSVFVRVTVRNPIFEGALENTDFTWCVGGDVHWFAQTEVSFDGEDALQSGKLLDTQQSALYGVAVGPGQVSFRWKVSSEAQRDFLRFLVDDAPVDAISGVRDWEEVIWNIPEGVHILGWVYQKDQALSNGADAGWVDQVKFVSFNTESPVIVRHPQPQSAFRGGTVAFVSEAVGSPPLSFQWFKGETLLANQTGSTLTLTNIATGMEGEYYLSVSNRLGLTTSRAASLFIFDESSAIDVALNRPNLVWTNYQYASWVPQVETSTDSISAVQTPVLGNDGIAWLGTTVNGPGVLYFYWKVSSERDYDLLEFLVDYELYDFVSGEVDWRDTSVLIPPGRHTVDWVYYKDETESSGTDAAWVDDVQFLPLNSHDYWKNLHFTPREMLEPRVSGDDADPDNDRRNNLIEYAFGSDPRSPKDPDRVTVEAEKGPQGTFAVLNYWRQANDPRLRYQLEVSADLRSWTRTLPSAWNETVTPAEEALEKVRARYLTPAANGKNRFFRVRVTLTPDPRD